MASVPDARGKLINVATAIQKTPAKAAGELGFTSRIMAQVGLPHREINTHHYIRRNGDFELVMVDVYKVGLPYGVIPRLCLIYVITEAVRTRSATVELGNHITDFVREIYMSPTGGRWGTITRVREQVNRLFNMVVGVRRCISSTDRSRTHNTLIAKDTDLWWNKTPGHTSSESSRIILTDDFFKASINNPVPIDKRVVRALTKSPLALDYYTWVTHRTSYLNVPTCISLEQLQMQFGSNYKTDRNGRSNFQRALKGAKEVVELVYPGANVEMINGRLLLFPGKTSV